MKKILMIINFFPPAAGGGVYRPLSFVRHLPGLSWDVTVITPRPGEFWISDPDLEKKIPAGVRVVRTPSLSGQRMLGMLRGKGGGTRRSSGGFGLMRRSAEMLMVPDSYVGWVPFARRAAGSLCRSERFDAVYSTSPPDSTHLAALTTARRYSLPWVADFRDPWIGLYLRKPPTALHEWLHRKYEKAVAGADRVLVTTDWQKEKLESAYPGCRVEKVPNGYEEEDFPAGKGDAPQAEPFTILHTGMLTLGRSSRSFLEGLSVLLRRSPELSGKIKVVFAGARESDNERWAERLGLGASVEFIDNVPHTECVLMERRSHVLLLIKHDDERYRGLVPGKLFEYIGARRPVLAVAPEGEAASIVKGRGRGEVAPPNDPSLIADAIERMYRSHCEGNLESSYRLGEIPEYSRRAGAESLDRIMRKMLEEG